jgi:microcystin-dependent protein
MSSGVYVWSQTAGSNASADSTINWAEGQAPSSVNDSARAMMAGLAKYRDDTCGANLGTGGTSTAYTLSSNQIFDTTAHMGAQELTVYFHITNGASPTLNVDGLGAFPIVMDGAGTAVPTGTLIAGTPYEMTFVNGSSHFRLKNFYQLPFTVPVGAMIDYFGTTAPNSNYVLPFGQAISRTTYATLFSLFSTTYGTGDGSTTFNIPDLRGRVVAGKDDMGGSAASRLTAATLSSGGTVLGSTSPAPETVMLGTANLPPYTPAGTNGTVTVNSTRSDVNVGGFATQSGGGGNTYGSTITLTSTGAGPTFTGTPQGGTTTPFSRLQPTIIANKLLRII